MYLTAALLPPARIAPDEQCPGPGGDVGDEGVDPRQLGCSSDDRGDLAHCRARFGHRTGLWNDPVEAAAAPGPGSICHAPGR